MLQLLLCLLLVGCCSNISQISTKSISQHAAGGTIVCDLVAIFDKKIAKDFLTLTSQQYFQKIGNLSKMHANQLTIWRFSQISESSNEITAIKWKKKSCQPKAVMIFADYRTDGKHQIAIKSNISQLNITFSAEGIEKLEQLHKTKGTATKEIYPTKNITSMNFASVEKN